MIERLSKFVSIRSLSGKEDELASAVCLELEQAGVRVHRQGNNVWCQIGDADKPRLLLNSHLDTVPASDGWSVDPWAGRVEDGRLIGLGANDAKGCVTAMIEAFLTAKRQLDSGKPLGGTILLALTAEEETSGQGLETILDHLKPIDAALVGEPTDLIPMTAQRGLLVLRGVARGRASHPANTPPDSDNNAIIIAAKDLNRLGTFDWGPEHPSLGRCHAHVTQINGGLAHNLVPDTCEFILDIRTTPGESHAALYERLSQFLTSDLHIHSQRLVPCDTPDSERIVQAVLRALPTTNPTGSPTMSDMVFLAGIPSVKIGPGQSQRSHTPDEFITTTELENGATAYSRIITEYFASRK